MSSLSIKIGFGYLVIVGIGIITALVVLLNVQSLRDEADKIYRDRYHGLLAAENLLKALQLQESAHMEMLVQDVAVARMTFNEHRDLFLEWYQKAQAQAGDSAVRRSLDTLLLTYKRFLVLTDSIQSMIEQGAPGSLLRDFQFQIIRPVTEAQKARGFQILDLNQSGILRANEEAQKSARTSALVIIAATLLNIGLGVIASITFTRRIVRPVKALTGTVSGIGRGQLDRKIDILTDDELGALGTEFNKMTERLRAYEEMNVQNIIAEKNRSQAIIASISDPVIVTDSNDRLLMINEAARALAPIAAGMQDPDGRRPDEIFTDEKWPAALCSDTMDDEAASQDTVIEVRRDDSTMYFRPRRRVIKDDRGLRVGVVTLFQDVTRFKLLETMKSDFLAAVSHEFRTPLTSITMSVDILLQRMVGELNDEQRDLLEGAGRDCARLKKLVEELLALSRLESVRGGVGEELVDVARVIEESLLTIELPIREKRLLLSRHVAEGIPPVRGNFQQLCWVIVNLAGNAVRYTPEGGGIGISARLDAGKLLVEISDTGRGIPADKLEEIFEPFVQHKVAGDDMPGSVGLGLAIARRVVENHGGEIRVESRLGEGSVFRFWLPLMEA